MDSVKVVGIDEDQYRTEVLCLAPDETETSHEQQLANEAQKLGLKVSEIEATASLAASVASGAVDLSSSPVLSSGSSTDRNSSCEVTRSRDTTRSRETSPINHVSSSLSEYTLASASDRVKPGSSRSLASLSTRPTSYSSTEGRTARSPDYAIWKKPGSPKSGSPGSRKEKRGFFGRFPFRRKRAPSTVLLPPAAQVTVAKGDGGKNRLYVESKPIETTQKSDQEQNDGSKLEVRFYDKESLQRSVDDAELSQLREAHTQERNRHLAFQAAALNKLRQQQQAAVPEKLAENKRLEDEKREKNDRQAARMEERQLAVEMEQEREHERAKMNSRTRIKYMERYFDNTSPPPQEASRPMSIVGPDGSPPPRAYTPQHKAQLEQELRDHESMDQLHESKIKVLRERQEVRLMEAIERMETELENLIDKHAEDFEKMQKQHQQEEESLNKAFDAKKTKLRHRWNLEEAILRKKLESKHGVPYGPLPPLNFTNLHYDTRDSAICVSEAGTDKAETDKAETDKTETPS